MGRLVVVNGPTGVGKSTVAPLLAARVTNGASISGDDLKRFVVRRAEPPTVETGLTYVGAGALADVFLRGGYDYDRSTGQARQADVSDERSPTAMVGQTRQ